jgi:hypothetical protein
MFLGRPNPYHSEWKDAVRLDQVLQFELRRIDESKNLHFDQFLLPLSSWASMHTNVVVSCHGNLFLFGIEYTISTLLNTLRSEGYDLTPAVCLLPKEAQMDVWDVPTKVTADQGRGRQNGKQKSRKEHPPKVHRYKSTTCCKIAGSNINLRDQVPESERKVVKDEVQQALSSPCAGFGTGSERTPGFEP